MTRLDEIAVAALLHDAGKVLERGRMPLSGEAQRMVQTVCPTGAGGQATHRHVLWTTDAVAAVCGRLPEGLDAGRVQRLANHHHRPGAVDDWVMAEADRLASGHDRRPDDAGEGEGRGRRDYRRVALESVLGRLRLSGAGRKGEPLRWRPAALATDERLLPRADLADGEVETAWRGLATEFLAALHGLDLRRFGPAMAVRAVAGVSERYQSLVPASAMDRPDTSLHDHALVTAALACALYRYHEATGTLAEGAVRDRAAEKFRFVVGSLGGIQEFIFRLPNEQKKGIARTYRANSFLVSVLTDAVVLHLLEATGYPPVAAVMEAGGRFLLLLDAAAETLGRLREAEEEVQRRLLERHAGTLGLRLAYEVTASPEALLEGRFGEVWRRVEGAANRAKMRSLAGWLQPGGAWMPERFVLHGVDAYRLRDEMTEEAKRLGGHLTRATAFGLFPEGTEPAGLLKPPIPCLGYLLQLGGPDKPFRDADLREARLAVSLAEDGGDGLPYRALANHVPVLTAEDDSRLQAQGADAETARETEADEEPPRKGAPATFSHLALLARREAPDGSFRGQPMLACLKADLDRLGLLFSEGIEGRDIAFARLASLSRFLDLFFKGHLTYRMEVHGSAYRHVYTVFSGGDDLMLIGPWPVMFRLAADLRGWLDAFTGGNPAVTLSAGLALAHPKTPPSHMARAAEEALERAKKAGRNRVTVLGRVLSWEALKEGLAVGDRLVAMLDREEHDSGGVRLLRSFVYRLLRHARSAERVAECAARVSAKVGKGEPSANGRTAGRSEELSIADLTWRSHYTYDLYRNVESRLPKSPSEGQAADLAWLQGLLRLEVPRGPETGDNPYTPVVVGATYALYQTRGGTR